MVAKNASQGNNYYLSGKGCKIQLIADKINLDLKAKPFLNLQIFSYSMTSFTGC